MNLDYYDERRLKLMSCEHWIRKLISLIPCNFSIKTQKSKKIFKTTDFQAVFGPKKIGNGRE